MPTQIADAKKNYRVADTSKDLPLTQC